MDGVNNNWIATYEGKPVKLIIEDNDTTTIDYDLDAVNINGFIYDPSNTATITTNSVPEIGTITINPASGTYKITGGTNSPFDSYTTADITCSCGNKKETIFDDKETIQELINRAIIDYYNSHKKDCISDIKELTKNIIYYLYGEEK